MGRFSGKVAIITGSSSGIGRTTAVLFAKEGAKVTITGRKADKLKETKAECISAGAKEEDILDIIGDITEDSVQEALINKTVEKFGALDILVNNHGGSQPESDAEGNWNVEVFEPIIKQNLTSSMAMCTKAIPHLTKSKGSIVNVSSIASKMSSPRMLFYGMAKVSLDHLTKVLAFKHAKDGIRVNCVNPGIIVTSFLTNMGLDEETAEKMYETMKSLKVPLQRLGDPMEIAEPIAFLADNKAAGYMTGQTMVVDGGVMLTNALS